MPLIGSLSHPTYLEIAGIVSLSYWWLYRTARFLLSWLLNQCQGASSRILKPGASDYAIITGATDGIGLEYAKQLAERGYNLVLLSRTEDKLRRVAAEIASEYPQTRKIEILAVDFSKTDIYERIKGKLESITGRIHVLVNNVGYAYPLPEYFTDYPDGYNLSVINTNIVSVTEMSSLVLRLMLKSTPDASSASTARGVIINISSFAGCTQTPLFSTYSSSKAYMSYLSRILGVEYAKDDIIIQTVTPNQVETKLSQALAEPLMIVPAEAFVRYALKTLGSESETSAHPRHKLINGFSAWIGGLLGPRLYDKLKYAYAKDLRVRYELKRKESQESGGQSNEALVGK